MTQGRGTELSFGRHPEEFVYQQGLGSVCGHLLSMKCSSGAGAQLCLCLCILSPL